MKVLIDTNALIKLLDPRIAPEVSARLKGLLEDIDSTNGQLIIPVQVVGEYTSGADQAGQELLAKLLSNRRIKVASFDHVAAVECAMMDKTAIASGGHTHVLKVAAGGTSSPLDSLALNMQHG